MESQFAIRNKSSHFLDGSHSISIFGIIHFAHTFRMNLSFRTRV